MAELSLDDQALEQFDKDFRDWPLYLQILTRTTASPVTSVLDVGGGNGVFLDRLLDVFPKAKGVLLDDSSYMLRRNKAHLRKRLLQHSALALSDAFSGERFDLITVNVLLHHLVGSTRRETRTNVQCFLNEARALLVPGGRLVVYEQCYEGWVPFVEPGSLIFALTSVRSPVLAKLMRRFGANTAGVGVAFRSESGWRRLFVRAGLELVENTAIHDDRLRVWRVFLLTIRRVCRRVFVLAPSHTSQALIGTNAPQAHAVSDHRA
jgi:SAM-dependent methyltransferase